MQTCCKRSSPETGYTSDVAILVARVKDGHLIVAEPVDLPEGATVRIRLLDEGENSDGIADMTEDERAEIDAAIETGRDEIRSGNTITAEELLKHLRTI